MNSGSLEWFVNKIRSQGTSSPSAYFGHSANGYQRFRHEQLLAYLIDACEQPPQTMLDIGCATGELTVRIADHFKIPDATGFDFVPDAIEYAKQNHSGISFEVGVLPSINAESGSQDLVIASEVIYYLPEDQRQETLQEIHRVLRPGGLLLFTSALGDGYFMKDTVGDVVGSYLAVRKTYWHYNKLYHQFMLPIETANELHYCLDNEENISRPRVKTLFQRYGYIFRSSFFRCCLGAFRYSTEWVLRSHRLPKCLAWIARKSGLFSPTNVTIIAQKSDAT